MRFKYWCSFRPYCSHILSGKQEILNITPINLEWVNLAIYPSKTSPNRSLEWIFKMEHIQVYVLTPPPPCYKRTIHDDIFINRNRWWTLKPQWLYTADIKTIGREQVGRSRRYEDLSADWWRKFLRRMIFKRVMRKGVPRLGPTSFFGWKGVSSGLFDVRNQLWRRSLSSGSNGYVRLDMSPLFNFEYIPNDAPQTQH